MKKVAARVLALAMSAACMLTMTACGDDTDDSSYEEDESVQEVVFSDGEIQDIEFHGLTMSIPGYLDGTIDNSTETAESIVYNMSDSEAPVVLVLVAQPDPDGTITPEDFENDTEAYADSARAPQGDSTLIESEEQDLAGMNGWYQEFEIDGVPFYSQVLYDEESGELLMLEMTPAKNEDGFDVESDFQQILDTLDWAE